jgi:tetratricopeptide (TPR) repeat protein
MKWLSAPGAAFQRWRAVGQLRSIEKREAADHHWDFDGMIDEAADMLERGQPSRAADLWRQANARFPDLAMQSRSLVNILLRLRLFDEAEDLLNRSMRRYPRSAHPLENLARVAYTRGDREEAVRRCEALRKKYPKSLDGYWSAAASLSELGRSQEAEDILGRGLKVIPDDVRLRAEHAKLAERRSDWEEGLRRWTIVLEIFNDVSGAVGIANALVQLGRHDEAEQQLSNILHQWGAYISVWIGLAQIAEHKEDWEEAARRWASFDTNFLWK